jgi:carbon monoxide dehydrogenase subunit G
MSVYTLTARIAAPPEIVFDLFTDIDRAHEWVGGVTKVTDVHGPVGQTGTTYTVWFGPLRAMSSPTEIIRAERPHHVRERFGSILLRGIQDVTFESDGNGTLLTQTFHIEGLLPRIMARIFATGSYRGSFRGELQTFVALAEREARG